MWKNPHPEKVIESIDFISAQAKAAPFLLGITLEPASEELKEALAMARKISGPEDPFTLLLMKKLAELQEQTGRKDEAAKLRAELEALKAKQ